MSTLTAAPNGLAPPPDAERELVARWGRYVRGEEAPPVIEVPQDIEALVAAREMEKKVRLTDAARWRARLTHFCARFHPGKRIIRFDTPAGPAIIAVGGEEVGLFHAHFLDALGHAAHEDYPCPPLDSGE